MTTDAATPEPTGGKQAGGKFRAGESGNPAGRPLGSRNKLGEQFVKALAEDFAAHGVDVISAVRRDKPDAYLRTIATVLPPAKSRSVAIDLGELKTAADNLAAFQIILKATSTGDLTLDEAQALAELVNAHGRALDLVEYDERLRKLEALQPSKTGLRK